MDRFGLENADPRLAQGDIVDVADGADLGVKASGRRNGALMVAVEVVYFDLRDPFTFAFSSQRRHQMDGTSS